MSDARRLGNVLRKASASGWWQRSSCKARGKRGPAVTAGPAVLSRRSVLAGTGALFLSFSAAHVFAQEKTGVANQTSSGQKLPGSLKGPPYLDSWIRIDANGAIAVFTGKAELGQGLKAAILQVAAEELDVPIAWLNSPLQTRGTR